MKKKMKILLALISLSLTLGLMSNTYSRYVADTTGDVSLLFANWQILVHNTDITNGLSSSINLVPILENNEHVTSNKVAPSSKGYFDIDIDPSNVDVSFNYSIQLGFTNENMPDLMITKYAILDETYVEGDEIKPITLTENAIRGTFNKTEEQAFKPFTIRVYFEWYEGENEQQDDIQDSAIGHQAAVDDTSIQIQATIHFEQKLAENSAETNNIENTPEVDTPENS